MEKFLKVAELKGIETAQATHLAIIASVALEKLEDGYVKDELEKAIASYYEARDNREKTQFDK